jgi:enterochelin esterase-like enzyme
MMRRFVFPFILLSGLLCHSLFLSGQPNPGDKNEKKGTVRQSLPFFSKTANDTLTYSIYFPPEYSAIPDSFPVFYLLHGLGGDENSWIRDFSVDRIADSLIQAGNIPPVIIVMPNGKRSYYINDYRHTFPYETVFISEFIPFIDSTCKTKDSKSYRAIGGLSMGGFGAMINAFRHPDYFSAVIALSAAVRTDSMIIHEKAEKYNSVFVPVFGDSIQQYNKVTQHWKENNPLYLVEPQPDTLKSVCWFIDCGLYDYLLPGNEALHDLFVQYRIPHEYHVRPGNHDRAYWKASLIPAMLFTGGVFNGKRFTD